MIEMIIVAVAALVLGWVGHVTWFSLYRKRFLISYTKNFTVVTTGTVELMFDSILGFDEAEQEDEDNEDEYAKRIEGTVAFNKGDS